FDAATARAVTQAQRDLGQAASASIGAALWPHLAVAVAAGDAGPAVSALQVCLGVPVGGGFDAATAAALRSARERAGLPPAGPADAAVWQAALA
ncbi:MAG TPA: hypothetical protein VD886_12455, partial [Herpetosiphonaceae bacterium]|nr:hypothetical protein [Herpetosiphonaceae bacterium]